MDRSHHPYTENLRLTQMCNELKKTKYMWYFIILLAATLIYGMLGGRAFNTIYEYNFQYILVMFCLILLTGLFFTWWILQLIICYFDENAIPEFSDEAKGIKNSIIAGCVLISAFIMKQLYDEIGKPTGNAVSRHFFDTNIFGGKRKLKR